MFWYTLTQCIECFPLDFIGTSFFFPKKNELQRLCVLPRTNRSFQCMFWYILTQCIECVPLDCIGISVTSENKKHTQTQTKCVSTHNTKHVPRPVNVFAHNLFCFTHTPKQLFRAGLYLNICHLFFETPTKVFPRTPKCFNTIKCVCAQSHEIVKNTYDCVETLWCAWKRRYSAKETYNFLRTISWEVFQHNHMCFTRTHERVLSVGLYRVA